MGKGNTIESLAQHLESYYKQGLALENCITLENGDDAEPALYKPLSKLEQLANEKKENFKNICNGNDVLNNFNSFSDQMKKDFLKYSIKSMAALEASQRYYEESKKEKFDKLHNLVLKKWD